MAHKAPREMRLILRVENGERLVGGKAVESAPMVGSLAEGTMRVLNLEVRGLSWRVGVVGERLMGGVVLGAGIDDDDVERPKGMDVPIVGEADVVWVCATCATCATCDIGAKKAAWEDGETSCGLTAAGEVSGDGSGTFVLDVDGGPVTSLAVVVEAGAVRVGFGFWFGFGSSDWVAGAGNGYSSRELGEVSSNGESPLATGVGLAKGGTGDIG